jgi:hypothetical protein
MSGIKNCRRGSMQNWITVTIMLKTKERDNKEDG